MDHPDGQGDRYAKRLKRRVMIPLDEVTIAYFKQLACETGIPYEALINLYLRDCAASDRRLRMAWKPPKSAAGAS